MTPRWILLIILTAVLSAERPMVRPGPPYGIVFEDAQGFLLANHWIHTQRIYVSLNPWHVYRRHIYPKTLLPIPCHDEIVPIEYASDTTRHMLQQLQMFVVDPDVIVGPKRLSTSVPVIGSLFKFGPSAADAISISTLTKHVRQLRGEMPEIKRRIQLSAQPAMPRTSKTRQGTVVIVNQHSIMLDETQLCFQNLTSQNLTSQNITSQNLTFQNLTSQNLTSQNTGWIFDYLMHSLLKQVSRSVSSLSSGRIPSYLVPISMVNDTIYTATSGDVSELQVRLAYGLGNAIPVHVDLNNMEIGFLLNIPIVKNKDIYRLKSVLNVGFWKANVHIHFKTPSMVAYHDDRPLVHYIPNFDMCTSVKDVNWICPTNPFLRNPHKAFCGLSPTPSQQCTGTMTIKGDRSETRVVSVGDEWVVSTPNSEIVVHHEDQDTYVLLTIPNQTVFVKVPEGVSIYVGKHIALHHLRVDNDREIEIPNAFQPHHDLNITDELQQLLAEGPQTVQFSLDKMGYNILYVSRLESHTNNGVLSGLPLIIILCVIQVQLLVCIIIVIVLRKSTFQAHSIPSTDAACYTTRHEVLPVNLILHNAS
ncbi:uncharacterized protein LOC134099725 [Sardina pilchardus]|uniref:uncharacterized protein LOC134099725 n=1 Tax=Sardina pilchardus TaxID=27697 RepID=UPI002E11AED3